MTIAALYLTQEGVVLGADSTTTWLIPAKEGAPNVAQLSNHAQKIFEVGDPNKGTLGVCTWGMGGFASKSIRHLVAELSDGIDKSNCPSFRDALRILVSLATEAYKATVPQGKASTFGMVLGGYVLPDRTPQAAIVEFTRPEIEPKVVDASTGRAYFFACHEIFTRLYCGYDPKLKQRIIERLGSPVFEEMTKDLALAGMSELPIRAAADYVYSLCYTTIQAYKYKFGAPVCGGPIEIAMITADRKFRWVHHKQMDSAIQFP